MVALQLSAEEVAAFWRDGFVHRRDVFGGEQLAVLRRDLNQLSGYAEVDVKGEGDVIGQEAWLSAEAGKYFTPVEKLHERSDAWRAVCEGVLYEQASELLGQPLVIDHALGLVKPPVKGSTFPLHQDGVYYSPADGRCVLANVYLDDVTPENGSLLLAVGSHTRLWPHDTTRGKKSISHPEQFTQLVIPSAQAGDVVYFHLWTVHGSAPNTSTKCRRAVRVGYVT